MCVGFMVFNTMLKDWELTVLHYQFLKKYLFMYLQLKRVFYKTLFVSKKTNSKCQPKAIFHKPANLYMMATSFHKMNYPKAIR